MDGSIKEAAYPSAGGGKPAANYLLADEAARPRFRSISDLVADGDKPVILIIGAGFTGLSAALHLAELRQASGLPARIVLLERARVASGPSGKSAGHICGLQAPVEDVYRHCGRELADRLIAAATDASELVRTLIARLAIPCDVRDGYVTIHSAGRQTVSLGGSEFGIASYPYALGLAHAAAALGVEIYEGVEVSGLRKVANVYQATTNAGVVQAAQVLACGGHRMAETIDLLAPLCHRTTELRVSTIMTAQLPDSVLLAAMPEAAGRRFPFANDAADVAYGSIDQENRIVFGAGATAWRKPDPARIAQVLARLLPSLQPDYRAATGVLLAWRPLVEGEQLCFTRDLLPNVGTAVEHPNVLYVQALGGNGIALGTLLGAAAAEKLWALRTGSANADLLFDSFAAVPHGWLPASQPWRGWTGEIGLFLHRRRS